MKPNQPNKIIIVFCINRIIKRNKIDIEDDVYINITQLFGDNVYEKDFKNCSKEED
jgi:hypothetical protein